MVDQTVRVEKDDVAATAAKLARDLWIKETGNNPKASDENFMALVATCAYALQGKDPTGSAGWIREFFPK